MDQRPVEAARQSTELDAVHEAIRMHGTAAWNLANRLESALARLGRSENKQTSGTIEDTPDPSGHMNRISGAFGSLDKALQLGHELMEKLEKVL